MMNSLLTSRVVEATMQGCDLLRDGEKCGRPATIWLQVSSKIRLGVCSKCIEELFPF